MRRPIDHEKWPLQAKRLARCEQSRLAAAERSLQRGVPLEQF
jgi:hypothetical protein